MGEPGPVQHAANTLLVVAGAVTTIRNTLDGAFLSDSERAHAATISHQTRRDEYIAGRMLLRYVASCLSCLEPAAISILKERSGKPYIAEGPYISLSHSAGIVAAAASASHVIGVDIEGKASEARLKRILPHLLPPLARAIDPLPEPIARASRLTAWTRREAVLKAAGCGLAGCIGAVDIWTEPNHADVASARFDGCTWRVLDIAPAHEVVGSIAYRPSRALTPPR
jgi:4'-phosphopantetheinyl transferase